MSLRNVHAATKRDGAIVVMNVMFVSWWSWTHPVANANTTACCTALKQGQDGDRVRRLDGSGMGSLAVPFWVGLSIVFGVSRRRQVYRAVVIEPFR